LTEGNKGKTGKRAKTRVKKKKETEREGVS